MKTEEFLQISEQAIVEVLRQRYGAGTDMGIDGARQRRRWPFLGAVELWVTGPDGSEEYCLGSSLNLSPAGLGLLIDVELERGQEVSLAVHEPEATLFGRAVVRHCTNMPTGNLVGLEFVYDQAPPKPTDD